MESVNFFGLAAKCWMTDMMQEDQTAFYKWISQWFLYCSTRLRHSCPQTCTHTQTLTQMHAHTDTNTHTDGCTPRPLRRVIITQLWLHKICCKDNQASQLAPLTFPPLSSPLYFVSSLCHSRPKFFYASLLLPFFSNSFSYVTVDFFSHPTFFNIFPSFYFTLFLRIHSVLVHSTLYTILVEH